jgi:hypothetical protein
MEYPTEVENTFTRKVEPLPNPRGMSGGGIWRARFEGAKVWTAAHIRLIGINSEFFEEDRRVKANRIEALAELLARHFREAAEYRERARQQLDQIPE